MLRDSPAISVDLLATTVADMVAESERLSFDKLLKPTEFEFDFALQVIQHEVSSAVEMARLHTQSALRTTAFCTGAMSQLKVLQEINPIKVTEEKTMDESLLAKSTLAVEQMDALMAKASYSTRRELWTSWNARRASGSHSIQHSAWKSRWRKP